MKPSAQEQQKACTYPAPTLRKKAICRHVPASSKHLQQRVDIDCKGFIDALSLRKTGLACILVSIEITILPSGLQEAPQWPCKWMCLFGEWTMMEPTGANSRQAYKIMCPDDVPTFFLSKNAAPAVLM